MFTGIVEEMGTVVALARAGTTLRLGVQAGVTLEGSDVGASVAVNGACLTVVERREDEVVFELGPETLARTTLGRLQPRSEEHTSELQSQSNLVCRLLLEKKKQLRQAYNQHY